MSLLANVLKQLESAPAAVPSEPAAKPPLAEAPPQAKATSPVAASPADSLAEQELQPAFPPPAPCPLTPVPSAPAVLFGEPIFALAPELQSESAYAAAPLAASVSPLSDFDFDSALAVEERLAAAESLVAASFVDPPFVAASSSVDLLASVSIARPYAEFWERLGERLRHSVPAAMLLLKVESSADGGWLFPLATAFAQANLGRVLIVDAASPARGPAIEGITARFGLTDALAGAADWRDAVAPTPTPRIDLLIRGQARQSAAAGADVRRLLGELKSAYRLVLTVADDASDPLVAALAGKCDAALLVADLEQTTRPALLQAKQALAACRAPLLGCIVRG